MKLSEWRQMRHQQHQESHLQESNTSADKEESDQMMVIKSMTPEAVSSLGGEISSLPLPVPPQQDNEETGRNKRRRTSKVRSLTSCPISLLS